MIHNAADQDFQTLEYLTQHLNEGIHLSSETLDEECVNYDVSYEDEGWLLVWGCGEFGQHGHGHQNDVSITGGTTNPLIFGQDDLVALIGCGSSHTVVVTDDQRIFSWGNCNSGQLGIGDTKTILQPHLVQLGVKPGTRIKGVECGTRHSFIWTEAGDCFSYGNNFSAQLGYDFRKPDFKENQLRPVYLETLFNHKIQQVACGSRHSVFLFTSGNVASVGSNDRGQLGHSGKIDSVCIQKVVDLQNISIIGCGNCHSLAADDGNVYAWGYGKPCGSKEDILSPITAYSLADVKGVKDVLGGDSHSLLLLGNGKLLSWGNNFEGQLGQGKSVKFQNKPSEIKGELLEEKVINISAGENISAAVTASGRLFIWGKNLSQVIREDEGPRYCQFDPHPIPLGKWKATKVACGAWHIACVVSPCTRQNTWNWTPPCVNMQSIPNHQFEAENFTEDILYDKISSQSNEEDSKEECVVDKDKEHTGNTFHIMENNLELAAQNEKDKGKKHHVHKCSIKETETESKNDGNKSTAQHENDIGRKYFDCTKKDILLSEKNGDLEEHCCHSINSNNKLTCDKSSTTLSNLRDPLPEKNKLPSTKESRLTKTYNAKHKIYKTHSEKRNPIRTSIKESFNNTTSQTNLISTSLCNIGIEQNENKIEVSCPERRSSTGTIRSTSSVHYMSAWKGSTGYQSASTSVVMETDQSKQRASTLGTGDYFLPGTKLKDFLEVTGQLKREKRAPRHLRKVPSDPKMEYYLPNQPIPQTCVVKGDLHNQKYIQKTPILSRTHSSPNITCNLQSDIHAITLSMPSTPPSGVPMPRPPQGDGLPPKHPRFRKRQTSQKLVFSSGSSWRKRSSKI